MKKDAYIDETKKFRYWLLREWDISLPKLAFIMLNPSTADADVDDPTIRRCIDFARKLGYGSIQVVNLFAYRATIPKALLSTNGSPIGEENDRYILETCKEADLIIAAWGVHGTLKKRGRYVENLITINAFDLYCLGVTSEGHPRHPLFVKGDTHPRLYKSIASDKVI